MSSKKSKLLVNELDNEPTTNDRKYEIKFSFLRICSCCGDEVEFHRGQESKHCPSCGNEIKLIID